MIDPECGPAQLADAYKATRYVVVYGDGELSLRVGERSWAVDQLLASHGAKTATFITGWNPHSRATSERENMEANRRLLADLLKSSVTVLDGYGLGDDGKWPAEPSFLGVGITRRHAEALGRRYLQNAILWICAGLPPELVALVGSSDIQN